MRTEFYTVSIVYANGWFVFCIIPENGINNAGIHTVPATNAFSGVKNNAADFLWFQCIGGTNPCTGRIKTGPANDHLESMGYSPCGLHSQAGVGKPAVTGSS